MLDEKRSEMVAEIRAFLDEIYNSHGKQEDLDAFSDEEIIELGEKPKRRCANGNTSI